jgi:hypothetical protein
MDINRSAAGFSIFVPPDAASVQTGQFFTLCRKGEAKMAKNGRTTMKPALIDATRLTDGAGIFRIIMKIRYHCLTRGIKDL